MGSIFEKIGLCKSSQKAHISMMKRNAILRNLSPLPIGSYLPQIKMSAPEIKTLADIKIRQNIEMPQLKTMKIIFQNDAKELLKNNSFRIEFKFSEKYYADKFKVLHRDAFYYFLRDFVVKCGMENYVKGLWILQQKIEHGMKYCQDIFLMNLDSLEGYLPPRYYNK